LGRLDLAKRRRGGAMTLILCLECVQDSLCCAEATRQREVGVRFLNALPRALFAALWLFTSLHYLTRLAHAHAFTYPPLPSVFSHLPASTVSTTAASGVTTSAITTSSPTTGTPTSAPAPPTVAVWVECVSVPEFSSGVITCGPNAVIDGVEFASFGAGVTGTCGSYTVGSCNSLLTANALHFLCVGSHSCTVFASSASFGQPVGCASGVEHTLVVEVGCSGIRPPTQSPTSAPTPWPTVAPTRSPTSPTQAPTRYPTMAPTVLPFLPNCLRRSPTISTQCRRCKNSTFNMNGECVDECPSVNPITGVRVYPDACPS
jgi:hypothetical protein